MGLAELWVGGEGVALNEKLIYRGFLHIRNLTEPLADGGYGVKPYNIVGWIMFVTAP